MIAEEKRKKAGLYETLTREEDLDMDFNPNAEPPLLSEIVNDNTQNQLFTDTLPMSSHAFEYSEPYSNLNPSSSRPTELPSQALFEADSDSDFDVDALIAMNKKEVMERAAKKLRTDEPLSELNAPIDAME